MASKGSKSEKGAKAEATEAKEAKGTRASCAAYKHDAPVQAMFPGFSLPVIERPPMTVERLLAMAPETRPLFVVADGMGLDSTGMLEGLRRLGLRPDVILHADTGNEHPDTVAYRPIRQDWLKRIGFPPFVLVKRPPSVSGLTGKPFATLGEKSIAYETLPSQAFGKKACSTEWKIVPQEQYLAKDARAQVLWAQGGKVVKAIGYDAGPMDSRRAHKLTNDECYEYVYPLREWGWDRPRITAELRTTLPRDIPLPRKSSCTFCPAVKPWELAEIVRDHPHLADEIIEMETKAAPKLRGIEGLWKRTVKGMRGAIAKPGRMTEFIEKARADPAYLQHYLDLEPEEAQYTGPVGGRPEFVGPGAAPKRLPLYDEGGEDDEDAA